MAEDEPAHPKSVRSSRHSSASRWAGVEVRRPPPIESAPDPRIRGPMPPRSPRATDAVAGGPRSRSGKAHDCGSSDAEHDRTATVAHGEGEDEAQEHECSKRDANADRGEPKADDEAAGPREVRSEIPVRPCESASPALFGGHPKSMSARKVRPTPPMTSAFAAP